MVSLDFAKFLLAEAKVAVSPGIGFGQDGEASYASRLSKTNIATRQHLRRNPSTLSAACGNRRRNRQCLLSAFSRKGLQIET